MFVNTVAKSEFFSILPGKITDFTEILWIYNFLGESFNFRFFAAPVINVNIVEFKLNIIQTVWSYFFSV